MSDLMTPADYRRHFDSRFTDLQEKTMIETKLLGQRVAWDGELISCEEGPGFIIATIYANIETPGKLIYVITHRPIAEREKLLSLYKKQLVKVSGVIYDARETTVFLVKSRIEKL